MKYEVVERSGEWVVQHRGVEIARFDRQAAALQHVSRRLEESRGEGVVSFAMRFEAKS